MQTTVTRSLDDTGWCRSLTPADPARPEAGVYRMELVSGVRVWVVAGYDRARAALADPRLSKDVTGLTRIMTGHLAAIGADTELSGMYSPHMLFQDGVEHTRLRGLVSTEFTRARVDALRPRVAGIVAGLLDPLPVDEPVDLVDALAYPLPIRVICDLLGVPDADQDRLRGLTEALMDDDNARNVPASRELHGYFTDLFAARRAEPGLDLLSALLDPANADRLTPDELMATVFLLFVAGHETSTNLIGNAIRWLLEDPDRWRALGADPALAPRALEEVLRFDSPVRMSTHRFTAEPVEYGGITIPAGEIVMVWLHDSSRDGSRFTDADHFDPDRRDAAAHLGFGHGPHYCLGAPLGRMEALAALTHLARHHPGARLAVPGGDLVRQQSAIMNGYRALPVVLGPRVG